MSSELEAQWSAESSSVDVDDRFMVHSCWQDDSTIDSDSEDVCNDSYEVTLSWQ